MNTTSKKCPLCAEQIPVSSLTCEYCGTRFEVISSGYCQNCHEIREADENGRCRVCANSVVDLRVESRFLEEPVRSQSWEAQPQTTAPSRPIIQSRKSLWLYGILGVFLVLVFISVGWWLGRSRLPALASLFATPTPSPTSIASTTITPTVTKSYTPTATPLPSQTPTITPTPLPGRAIIPIEEMTPGIPWLPADKVAEKTIFTISIDVKQSPFDNLLVRQALAAALDRQALAQIARENSAAITAPATSFTPAEVLGRDLYGQVGISFDPDRAWSLLAQAGYANGAGFPSVSIATNVGGMRLPVVNAVVQMWKEHLNITVKVVELDFNTWNKALEEHTYPLIRVGWPSLIQDPSGLLSIYRTGHQGEAINFSNSQFDQLIDHAAQLTDPLSRQGLYIQAERILCEEQVPVIPLFSFSE